MAEFPSQPATTESVAGSMKRTYPRLKRPDDFGNEDVGKLQRIALSTGVHRKEDDRAEA